VDDCDTVDRYQFRELKKRFGNEFPRTSDPRVYWKRFFQSCLLQALSLVPKYVADRVNEECGFRMLGPDTGGVYLGKPDRHVILINYMDDVCDKDETKRNMKVLFWSLAPDKHRRGRIVDSIRHEIAHFHLRHEPGLDADEFSRTYQAKEDEVTMQVKEWDEICRQQGVKIPTWPSGELTEAEKRELAKRLKPELKKLLPSLFETSQGGMEEPDERNASAEEPLR
jgi:hypothetical protein